MTSFSCSRMTENGGMGNHSPGCNAHHGLGHACVFVFQALGSQILSSRLLPSAPLPFSHLCNLFFWNVFSSPLSPLHYRTQNGINYSRVWPVSFSQHCAPVHAFNPRVLAWQGHPWLGPSLVHGTRWSQCMDSWKSLRQRDASQTL